MCSPLIIDAIIPEFDIAASGTAPEPPDLNQIDMFSKSQINCSLTETMAKSYEEDGPNFVKALLDRLDDEIC